MNYGYSKYGHSFAWYAAHKGKRLSKDATTLKTYSCDCGKTHVKGNKWVAGPRHLCSDCRRKHLRLIEQLYRQTGKVAAKNALQRARRLQATPVWVDIEALRSVYVEAKQLSKERSINYHVDHIVPLQHPLVCGLHVPWNLQIITAEQNILKSNNFVPS
jgi:hypothetical protein